MVYSMLFIYIITYSYIVKTKEKKVDFIFFFLPIGILLLLTLSLQNNVGTDYTSYIALADGSKGMGWMEAKYEILFINLVHLVRFIGEPQLIFLFVAAIQVFFLFLITYEVKKIGYKLHHFFFLYFALSLVFFNQFNGIRQYISVYIIIYALFKLRENKKKLFVFLVIVASLFHSSAIFFIVFIFLRKLLNKKIPITAIMIIMLGLLTLRLIDINSLYVKILSYTKYSHYAYSSYFGKMGIRGIITKIPKIIIVLSSSYLIEIKTDKIIREDRFLLNLSYVSVAVMILSFTSTLIWRFYQYLDLFIIYPVLILMEDRSNRKIKILIATSLIIMLVIKIIVIPQGEYLYSSILFKH